MSNSKQSLNELNPLEYAAVISIGGLAIKGIAAVIARKLAKKYGVLERGKTLLSYMWNRNKLKAAGVTDNEMGALYANGGAAIVDLGKQFTKEVFEKVKAGKITPEQAINDLDGIIPESARQDWLKKFKTIAPAGAKAGSSILKATYSKIVGPAVTKDVMEAALTKVYGAEGLAKAKRAYQVYLDQYNAGKLVVPFKNKSVFPNIDDWTAATGWKPKNPNLGFNDKLMQQKSAYRWHKLIWTLHH